MNAKAQNPDPTSDPVWAALRGRPFPAFSFAPLGEGRALRAARTSLSKTALEGSAKEVSLECFSIKHRTLHQFIDDHVFIWNVRQFVIAWIVNH